MANYFTFGGLSSADYNVYLADGNLFDTASRDVESISIPGRSGTLTKDNNRYNNFTYSLKCYLKGDPIEGIPAFADAVLFQSAGYLRLTDSIHSDIYRMAKYSGGLSIDKSDRQSAVFTLDFDCMPQCWLTSGETETTITASTAFANPTNMDAKPLLRVYGSGAGTVTVGSETITISAITDYVDIDLEALNAYCGATNCNGDVDIPDDVVLTGGASTTISFTGDITSIVVTPRYWRV